MQKNYRTEVISCDNHANPEVTARFSIDENTAREIARLAGFVASNGLHKIEKIDDRTTWRNSEDPFELKEVTSDANALHVTGTEFWFSATLKHNSDVRTERQRIFDLVDFLEANNSVGDELPNLEPKHNIDSALDEALQFVTQVANLKIWDYDQDNGKPYHECDEPSDGYLDSHCCLMDLIEQARGAQRGSSVAAVSTPT